MISLISTYSYAKAVNVVFISPNPEISDNEFWQKSIAFGKKAAKDLNINLEIVFGGTDRFRYRNDVFKISKRNIKPDYVVLINYFGTAEANLQSLEAAKIKSFTISTNLSKKEKIRIGDPRKRFKYWIGHLVPDDFQAGYLLAKALIKDQKSKSSKTDVSMIALAGGRDSSSSIERENGLKAAVKESVNVKLHQIVHVHWNGERAAKAFLKLKNRYPDTNVVWTAADVIALGIIKKNAVPLDKYSIGGIDWSSKALNNVIKKKLTTSVGNHFLQIAFSLILIKDFSLGLDFKKHIGTKIKIPMQNFILGKYNISDKSKINFRDLSLFYNPKKQGYNFAEFLLKK